MDLRDPAAGGSAVTGLVASFDELVDVTLDEEPCARAKTHFANALSDKFGLESKAG